MVNKNIKNRLENFYSPKKSGGFSLWLMPVSDMKKYLTEIIAALANENHTHAFSPHLTLLSSIEGSEKAVIRKAQLLATHLSPMVVNFRGISHQNQFFRSLYYQAVNNDDLSLAHKVACKVFKQDEAEFMPHLSLMYSNLATKLKEQIIANWAHLKEFAFLVDTLYLYKTEGEVSSWQLVEKFPLQRTYNYYKIS